MNCLHKKQAITIDENMDKIDISRFELHKVADFLPYPFIIAEVIDGTHHNTFLNEKFIEEIGYAIDEIPTIEKWYENAYPDEIYRNNVIRAWDKAEIESQEEEKVFVKMKSQVTCKNGTKRWYEIKATVINKIHVVAFVDLDKEIALQEELKSINRNNDRMLSILGHDLRSPIANLTSVSSMALDKEISQGEFSDFIHMINEQSIQVLEMLETTFSWAKLNFNAIQENKVSINVNILINTILKIYTTSYVSKNITIKVAIDNNQEINSDIEILTVMIRNVISNAIKFTPLNGEITIGFNNKELVISDNGIGMSASMVSDIWENNFASRRGTNNEVGMGMGMQLVLNLADKINCKVAIESEQFKGTVIRLTFLE